MNQSTTAPQHQDSQTWMPLPSVLHRKCGCGQHTIAGGVCTGCSKEHETSLQRSAVNKKSDHAPGVPPIVHEVLNSSGQSLDAGTRAFMEPRFGHDFSHVRVHTDDRAASSARSVNAHAYTVGKDIVFGAGQFAPQTRAGLGLIAHELTHVIQQRGSMTPMNKPAIGPAGDSFEVQADQVAERVLSSLSIGPLIGHGKQSLQRRPIPGNDLTATRFAGNAVLEAVLDGTQMILNGSRGTAVRLIQESLLAQGYTLPRFGADGDFGDETKAAVLRFQTDAGARMLDGKVGPETMKLLDMHDTGTTAPTGPRAAPRPAIGPAPPPATAAAFSESPQELFAGYDDSVVPNWLVVPVGGRRQARINIVPAPARPTLRTLNPGIATVDPTPNGAVVTGVADGHTNVEAREGATLLDTLQIEVKDRRDVTVHQHFMRDSARPAHRTARPTGQADLQTARLNRIWERQANVRFRTGTVNTPTVASDLGTTVMWTGAAADGWSQVTAFATGGGWDVFWVWEYEQDATPAVDDANAGTAGTNTLSEDHDCPDGLTLAHEAGHFLSGGALPHTANGIMGACGAANYDRVRKTEADAVNL
jgi:peptidoglycan hydrolase-like protein with peptidoglycan-binding domain